MATWSSLFPTNPHLYSAKTSNFTVSAVRGYRYFVDCTGGNITVTLPTALGRDVNHLIKRVDNTVNTLTIARSGADLIDGEVSQSLSPYEAVWVNSDGGSNWWLS